MARLGPSQCCRALAFVAVAWGCGSPATTESSADTFQWALDVPKSNLGDSSKFDTPSPDALVDGTTDPIDSVIGSDTESSDVVAPENDVDTGVPELPFSNCAFPVQPAKGEPGSSCATSADCDTGLCVDSPTGKICTINCTDCCPSGFKCATYKGGVDPVLACLAAWTDLCKPCEADAECAADPGALCVAYAGTGSFCASPCATSTDCPDGFACIASQGTVGAGKQCVKQTGECGCSPAATSAGAKTQCSITNDAGTCSGVRKCTLTGLTACPASTPEAETCDGADNNCDGVTDEVGALGCVTGYPDADGDGFGKIGGVGKCLCTAIGNYTASTATDCDDANPAIYGGAAEQCDNVDNNCNGLTDEGCDDDGDGWCDGNFVVTGTPIVCPKGQGDCDDAIAGVHPTQQELCGNGLDDNCDGQTDSGGNATGCVAFYLDGDGDGFGSGSPTCACGASGLYTTSKPGDCNDDNQNVNPSKSELCGNSADDNCNGLIDEADAQGCTPYYTDDDNDGYGVGTPLCLCAPDATHTAAKSGDCNDQASAKHPGAAEVCNGTDDDCDGVTDQAGATGCTMVYPDGDGDGYGLTPAGTCLCAVPPTGYAVQSGDCNDQASAAHPGAAEICDGVDNNCNGQIDESGAQGCVQYFLDIDADGYGDASQSQCTCATTGNFTATKSGDCNDQALAIHPGALESCDGKDNNCDGQIDEAGAQGCTIYAPDSDGDNFGAVGDTQCLCTPGAVYNNTKATDCNDQNKAIHPGVDEVCDGVDNNCDGVTDPNSSDGCKNGYLDQDGDGYGTYQAVPICTCSPAPGYASLGGGCNDGNAIVHPGATEICNGLDDDCNGAIDGNGAGNCVTYYNDADNDGFGVGAGFCMCAPFGTLSATAGADCNDNKAAIYPTAPEVCNDVDDNCNSQTDEGVKATYYADGDNDGYGVGVGSVLCAANGTYKVTANGDCNDGSANVHPNAVETCNSLDDNCNGQTDEGLAGSYYADVDKDGYGTGNPVTACSAGGLYTAVLGGDCNDNNLAIYPNANEACDGLDNNCNGQTDEGISTQTYYLDADKDGYGVGGAISACGPLGSNTATQPGDCLDSNAAVNPAHGEVCNNGLDDDCSGVVDQGCALCLNTSYNMHSASAAGAANWKLYNNAAFDSAADGIDLVPSSNNKRGQVYYTAGRIAAAKTHIEFDFAVDQPGYADGIALNLIDVANLAALETYIAATVAANKGECIGYGVAGVCGSGSVSGLHLKLDTHYNSPGDKISGSGAGYEFALTQNGDPENYVPNGWFDAWNGVPGDIEDWTYHHYIVDINGTSFKATIDGNTALNLTLPSAFKGGFIGFSAATGGSSTIHEVGNFTITQTNCP